MTSDSLLEINDITDFWVRQVQYCGSFARTISERRKAGAAKVLRQSSTPRRSIWRTPDQDRRTPLRRLEISFSQGAEWKALISKYIGTIPLSGDARATEQSISAGRPSRAPVSSAMIAKVGAAARHSQSAAPSAAALAFSSQLALSADPPE